MRGTQDPLFVNSFQKGDENAFDCLFREYFSALTYFSNRILSDRKAAEDIVQDCFVSLWQRRNELGHVGMIKAYLYKSVRNQSLKYLEKSRRQENPFAESNEPTIEEAIIAGETARELHHLIATLSPALQNVIRLYFLEGKSNHEIAEQLNIEPDTVIRQRLRAILALRKTKISL